MAFGLNRNPTNNFTPTSEFFDVGYRQTIGAEFSYARQVAPSTSFTDSLRSVWEGINPNREVIGRDEARQIYANRLGVPVERLDEVTEGRLDKKIGDENILKTVNRDAYRFAEAYRARRISERGPSGFWGSAVRFVGAAGAELTDPISMAMNFVPVVREGKYMRLVNKYGKFRATTIQGVAEGAVGSILTEPLYAFGERKINVEDYTMEDAFYNVLMGVVISTGMHHATGYFGDFIGTDRTEAARNWAALNADGQLDLSLLRGSDELKKKIKAHIDNVDNASLNKADLKFDEKLGLDKLIESLGDIARGQLPDVRYNAKAYMLEKLLADPKAQDPEVQKIIKSLLQELVKERGARVLDVNNQYLLRNTEGVVHSANNAEVVKPLSEVVDDLTKTGDTPTDGPGNSESSRASSAAQGAEAFSGTGKPKAEAEKPPKKAGEPDKPLDADEQSHRAALETVACMSKSQEAAKMKSWAEKQKKGEIEGKDFEEDRQKLEEDYGARLEDLPQDEALQTIADEEAVWPHQAAGAETDVFDAGQEILDEAQEALELDRAEEPEEPFNQIEIDAILDEESALLDEGAVDPETEREARQTLGGRVFFPIVRFAGTLKAQFRRLDNMTIAGAKFLSERLSKRIAAMSVATHRRLKEVQDFIFSAYEDDLRSWVDAINNLRLTSDTDQVRVLKDLVDAIKSSDSNRAMAILENALGFDFFEVVGKGDEAKTVARQLTPEQAIELTKHTQYLLSEIDSLLRDGQQHPLILLAKAESIVDRRMPNKRVADVIKARLKGMLGSIDRSQTPLTGEDYTPGARGQVPRGTIPTGEALTELADSLGVSSNDLIRVLSESDEFEAIPYDEGISQLRGDLQNVSRSLDSALEAHSEERGVSLSNKEAFDEVYDNLKSQLKDNEQALKLLDDLHTNGLNLSKLRDLVVLADGGTVIHIPAEQSTTPVGPDGVKEARTVRRTADIQGLDTRTGRQDRALPQDATNARRVAFHIKKFLKATNLKDVVLGGEEAYVRWSEMYKEALAELKKEIGDHPISRFFAEDGYFNRFLEDARGNNTVPPEVLKEIGAEGMAELMLRTHLAKEMGPAYINERRGFVSEVQSMMKSSMENYNADNAVFEPEIPPGEFKLVDDLEGVHSNMDALTKSVVEFEEVEIDDPDKPGAKKKTVKRTETPGPLHAYRFHGENDVITTNDLPDTELFGGDPLTKRKLYNMFIDLLKGNEFDKVAEIFEKLTGFNPMKAQDRRSFTQDDIPLDLQNAVKYLLNEDGTPTRLGELFGVEVQAEATGLVEKAGTEPTEIRTTLRISLPDTSGKLLENGSTFNQVYSVYQTLMDKIEAESPGFRSNDEVLREPIEIGKNSKLKAVGVDDLEIDSLYDDILDPVITANYYYVVEADGTRVRKQYGETQKYDVHLFDILRAMGIEGAPLNAKTRYDGRRFFLYQEEIDAIRDRKEAIRHWVRENYLPARQQDIETKLEAPTHAESGRKKDVADVVGDIDTGYLVPADTSTIGLPGLEVGVDIATKSSVKQPRHTDYDEDPLLSLIGLSTKITREQGDVARQQAQNLVEGRAEAAESREASELFHSEAAERREEFEKWEKAQERAKTENFDASRRDREPLAREQQKEISTKDRGAEEQFKQAATTRVRKRLNSPEIQKLLRELVTMLRATGRNDFSERDLNRIFKMSRSSKRTRRIVDFYYGKRKHNTVDQIKRGVTEAIHDAIFDYGVDPDISSGLDRIFNSIIDAIFEE